MRGPLVRSQYDPRFDKGLHLRLGVGGDLLCFGPRTGYVTLVGPFRQRLDRRARHRPGPNLRRLRRQRLPDDAKDQRARVPRFMFVRENVE